MANRGLAMGPPERMGRGWCEEGRMMSRRERSKERRTLRFFVLTLIGSSLEHREDLEGVG